MLHRLYYLNTIDVTWLQVVLPFMAEVARTSIDSTSNVITVGSKATYGMNAENLEAENTRTPRKETTTTEDAVTTIKDEAHSAIIANKIYTIITMITIGTITTTGAIMIETIITLKGVETMVEITMIEM